jgi:predicted chitinase
MAIIGQEIEDYVASQINARQILHGSGAPYANGSQWVTNERTESQINLLNSNTSWIKLASGVSIDSTRLVDIGVTDSSLVGMGLAKKYILYAGISRLTNNFKLVQREGFLPQQDQSSYTYGEYGYSPMPGIISADIKALNRGSLKKATVKIKVNNKQQFNIIDALYLRLGYTVMLEWGNSIFTTNGKNREVIRNTIIDDPKRFFNKGFKGSRSYRDILGPIEFYRKQYAGNYDGLLGKISNFNWSFNKDGSYDIEITIISLGDVVESLKLNISSDQKFQEFLEQQQSATPPGNDSDTPPEPDPIEENKDANAITSMLWAWKYSNEDALQSYQNNGSENDLHIIDGNDGINYVGGFLKNSKTITGGAVRYKFIFELFSRSNVNGGFTNEGDTNVYEPKYKKYSSIPSFIELGDDADQFLANQASSQGFKSFESETTGLKVWKRESDTQTETLSVRYEIAGFESQTVDSPISDAPPKSACFLITEPKQLYLRFGYLLHFIYKKLIPKIKTKDADYDDYPSIFKMRYDIHDGHKQGFTQVMYSLPNQISLDPRVCIVRNNRIEKEAGINKAYTNLLPFRTSDYVDSGNPNKAYSSNIYLNFEFIIECLNSNTDERGDVSVYNFLKAICDGLNKALGGVNNLEPVMDEETNTLSIIDTTPIPGLTGTGQNYTLQLYGYDKVGNQGYISNFIRNVDLKTAITPEFATMITVGATAGGYVKGTEATAFSRWNVGLTDRFQEEYTPGNINSSPTSGSDEAVVNYNKKMLAVPKITQFYGFSGNIQGGNSKNLKISTDAIETNLSVGTEYYKYIIASKQTENGGTVGFIPFKISFTMDGLSGIKIYNKLHVNTRFLPKAYGDSLDLIVTGVSHKLQKNDWETDIEATVIPKTTGTTTYTPTTTTTTQQSGSAPGTTPGADAPLGSRPPSTGWEIIHDVNPKLKPGTTKGDNIDLLIKTFKDQGVTNPYAIVAMLCVVGKEGGYEPIAENMNYSYGQLIDMDATPWPFFAKNEDNKKIAYHLTRGKYYGKKGGKETFANYIYGWDKSLPPGFRSNPYGNTSWGDGYKYRGRGFNQITWKGQYKSYGEKIGIDLVKYPDKLLEPAIAAKVCFFFFRDRFKNAGYDPISYWNNYSDINAAITQFANANGGSVKETASHGAYAKSKAQRPNFDIIVK